MTRPLGDLIAKIFEVLTGKSSFLPDKIFSVNVQPCMNCDSTSNYGHFRLLEEHLIFIHNYNSLVLTRLSNIKSAESTYCWERFDSNTFALSLTLMPDEAGGDTGTTDRKFSDIDRSDYAVLFRLLNNKKTHVLDQFDDDARSTPHASGLAGVLDQEEIKRIGAKMSHEESNGEDDDNHLPKTWRKVMSVCLLKSIFWRKSN